jgi:hypothetical protein
MAIWQYDLDFMPREKLLMQFGEIPSVLDNWVACDLGIFDGVRVPSNYQSLLARLGEFTSLNWVPGSINYGDYDNGSHLTIYDLGTDMAHVGSRLDVGNWNEDFAIVVMAFAKACECVLLTKNDVVIEPDYDLLIADVRVSSSYRFCNDPKGYLLSDEVKELNANI